MASTGIALADGQLRVGEFEGLDDVLDQIHRDRIKATQLRNGRFRRHRRIVHLSTACTFEEKADVPGREYWTQIQLAFAQRMHPVGCFAGDIIMPRFETTRICRASVNDTCGVRCPFSTGHEIFSLSVATILRDQLSKILWQM